ncbi:rod shape-determining protein MreC [Sulfurihydrogenibium sp.]|uniref:rod shape-determining protein MreC n=1 Tax=Sulfurihydrogenibium sp. TaxID=2053621 RepID=UPI00261D2A6E|nr:rod shape-determining protein MreC [Sulfurihydrogenibium sp.]
MLFNVKRKLLKVTYFLIGISIVLFIIFSNFFKGLSVDFIGVPNKAISSIVESFNNLFVYLQDKKSLLEENKSLKKQIEILKLENQKNFYLEKENEALKKMLDFKNYYGFSHVLVGKVIGFSPDNWVDGFFIDLGKKENIKEGDLVVAGGYLIGIVKVVGQNFSEVMSVNDKNFKITVRTRKTGEICFYNGLDYKKGVLKYVRPEQDIRFSDVVETTVINSSNPEGIPIGIVRKISTKEGEFFREIEIETFYYPYSLNYVLVIPR